MSFAMLWMVALLRALPVSDALPLSLRLALFICSGAIFYIAATWLFARPALMAAVDAARIVLKSAPAKA
jgi:hypothetical protein